MRDSTRPPPRRFPPIPLASGCRQEPLRDPFLEHLLSLDFPGFFKEEFSGLIPELRRDLESRPDPRTWAHHHQAQHLLSVPLVRRRRERELLLTLYLGNCWKLCKIFRRKFLKEISESSN